MRPGPSLPPSKHKKFIVLLTVLIAIIIFGAVIIIGKHRRSPVTGAPTVQDQTKQAEAINGLKVNIAIAQQRPIAIVIENHPDARPQSSLSQADIVYETLAEGGITRYMAIFQTQAPANIGPIRSARVYFNELADQWHTMFAHVGGNSDALTAIRNGDYKNLSDADQFFNEQYFHRITTRQAPHNVYTSIDKLRNLMTASHYNTIASYSSWKFKDDTTATPPTATIITIPFSTPSYTVSYQYDKSDNSYKRFLAGQPDRDANNNQQIKAKDVVIQFADDFPTQTDTVGSLSFKLSGSGKAKIFMDGVVINATWNKDNGITRYFDSTRKELSFNRGSTWIELVPTGLETNLK